MTDIFNRIRNTSITFKVVFICCLIQLLCLLGWNCKNTEHGRQAALKFAPPGTNYLKDNLFIDEAEVTNLSWREYMYWIKKVYGDTSPQYLSTLPDTLVWRNYIRDFKLKYNNDLTDVESLIYLYLRHPQFSHHPVVGISFEQAAAFCSWRSNRVNEVLYIEKNKHVTFPIDSSIVIPKKVLFRLPDEKEWEEAARMGFDSSRFAEISTEKISYNTRDATSLRGELESYDRFIPMVEISLQPDKYNRYHLIGNVAEMTSTKGVAKGGSYIHILSDSYYTKKILYNKPNYWLGFRCVCEILKHPSSAHPK